MITLKELNTGFIPAGGRYSSQDWYISIAGVIEKILRARDGKRELQDFVTLPPFTLPDAQYITDMTAAVKDQIDVMFIVNDESYARIYRALTEEYNPIWNVDGTETLEYTKDNTGTQGNKITHTGTQDIDDTHSGSLTTTDTLQNTTTTSRTSYDSATLNVAEQVTSVNGPTGQQQVSDTTKIERDRTDNLTDDGTRTDNLHENYKETKTRAGNIGVTKSSELVEDEVKARMSYKFAEIVEHDILKTICYAS